MKGKYEWTENHEKRFIYLWNSRTVEPGAPNEDIVQNQLT